MPRTPTNSHLHTHSFGPDAPAYGSGNGTSPDRLPEGVYIRQAAQMVGVLPATIRMWEKHGLISPQRTSSGYRVYSLDDVERLRKIRHLMETGLNSAGTLAVLELEDGGVRSSLHNSTDGNVHRTVGERLRGLRRDRGLSLRDLSEKTQLSPSYISALERSLSTASISSLQKLAAALDTQVPALLGGSVSTSSPVVRRRERQRPPGDTPGVVFEDLSTTDSQLEPLLMIIHPGAGSDGSYCHEGEEFLFMLKGRLHITLDGVESYDLETGDAMTFDSMRPHEWSNLTDRDTVIIWVNTPRTF